jgi:sortase A
MIVLAGGSGRTLAFGPGHLSASSLPGESLVIEKIGGRKHLYKVVAIDVVDARRGSLLLDTDAAMLSLVTCYPFESLEPGGPMRYVVTAKMLF